MKYRNKKTGAIINVNSVINGENWEKVETSSPSVDTESEEKPKKKKKAKEE